MKAKKLFFIIILYIFSTLMIISSKSPLKNSHIIENRSTIMHMFPELFTIYN